LCGLLRWNISSWWWWFCIGLEAVEVLLGGGEREPPLDPPLAIFKIW